ncbi:glucose dehydrogenase [FAD, quinone]-like [Trichoplusia ni]|uniref:Glucose dehydrogenase [FAD, quinone]-like n=1 Tax=Trichoplusia ni TaxID=7111 RepID=A0A7E5X336_TRINI|nr:glucose dehydrogenase [FAD, quinone]-like [Trichoplusia ni]
MLYSRGNPSDYEKIYEITQDPTWKWDNMLKYFIMSEQLDDQAVLSSEFGEYHGTDGPIGVTKENREVCDEYLRAFEEAGEDVVVDNVGAGILGYSSSFYHILDGLRTTSSESYLPPLNNNPNLYLTRYSTAKKILFDGDNNVVGVTYLKDGQDVTVFANNEVIVTAGSIKSAQLLMLSGIGPKKHLKNMDITVISDLPVGQNLHNAVGAALVFKTNRKADSEVFDPHEIPAPVIVGYAAFNKSDLFPNYESLNFVIDDHQYMISFCGFTIGIENSICDELYKLTDGTQVLWSNLNVLNPKSRGEIQLRSLNPEDQPVIETGYFSDDQDLEDVVDAILDFIKIESTPFGQDNALQFLPVAEMCNGIEFGSRDYWRCYVLCMTFVSWRDAGTCAIGEVVDTKLAVKGVQRLRVVDTSVFPYALGGAIFAPTVALAEKAAEMIIHDQYQNMAFM